MPNDPRQAFVQGYTAFRNHNPAFAVDCLKFATDRDPVLADYSLYYLGLAERDLSRDPDAEAALRRLIANYPQSVFAARAELTIAEIELEVGPRRRGLCDCLANGRADRRSRY